MLHCVVLFCVALRGVFCSYAQHVIHYIVSCALELCCFVLCVVLFCVVLCSCLAMYSMP